MSYTKGSGPTQIQANDAMLGETSIGTYFGLSRYLCKVQ